MTISENDLEGLLKSVQFHNRATLGIGDSYNMDLVIGEMYSNYQMRTYVGGITDRTQADNFYKAIDAAIEKATGYGRPKSVRSDNKQ